MAKLGHSLLRGQRPQARPDVLGFAWAPEVAEHAREVAKGSRRLRVGAKSRLKARGSPFAVAKFFEGSPEIVVRLRKVRIDSKRPPERLGGAAVVGKLEERGAAVVVGDLVLGVGLNRAVEGAQGVLKAAEFVVRRAEVVPEVAVVGVRLYGRFKRGRR